MSSAKSNDHWLGRRNGCALAYERSSRCVSKLNVQMRIYTRIEYDWIVQYCRINLIQRSLLLARTATHVAEIVAHCRRMAAPFAAIFQFVLFLTSSYFSMIDSLFIPLIILTLKLTLFLMLFAMTTLTITIVSVIKIISP